MIKEKTILRKIVKNIFNSILQGKTIKSFDYIS